jgi:hypothetical protein
MDQLLIRHQIVTSAHHSTHGVWRRDWFLQKSSRSLPKLWTIYPFLFANGQVGKTARAMEATEACIFAT